MAASAPENELSLDLRDHLLRIDEQLIRIDKMRAETEKTLAEVIQIKQNTRLEPWRIYAAAAASAIAVFAAATALVKLVL